MAQNIPGNVFLVQDQILIAAPLFQYRSLHVLDPSPSPPLAHPLSVRNAPLDFVAAPLFQYRSFYAPDPSPASPPPVYSHRPSVRLTFRACRPRPSARSCPTRVRSHAWKVVYLDSTSPPRKTLPPRSPTKDFAALEETNHITKLQRIQATSMAATAAPRCLPWSSPGDPTTWQQPQGVQDQPYKKAFSRGESGGGASREGRGRRGGGRGRGGGAPKSVAWRKDTSAPGIRQGGGRGRGRRGGGRGGRQGGRTGGGGGFAPASPRIAPAGAQVKARVSPPVARHGPGSSMSFGGGVGRLQCRVRL